MRSAIGTILQALVITTTSWDRISQLRNTAANPAARFLVSASHEFVCGRFLSPRGLDPIVLVAPKGQRAMRGNLCRLKGHRRTDVNARLTAGLLKNSTQNVVIPVLPFCLMPTLLCRLDDDGARCHTACTAGLAGRVSLCVRHNA
jgi:hypothetical protein